MARIKRGETAKIKRLTLADTDIYVDLRVNLESGVFTFQFGDAVYEAQSLAALEKLAQKAMAESISPKWTPVVGVTPVHGWDYSGNSGTSHSVGFKYSRFYVAVVGSKLRKKAWDGKVKNYYSERDTPVGHPLHASEDWGREEVRRDQSGMIVLPQRAGDRGEKTTYLAYTEELWEGLGVLAKRIDALDRQLRDMIGGDQLAAMAEAAGRLQLAMLPAPAPAPAEEGVTDKDREGMEFGRPNG